MIRVRTAQDQVRVTFAMPDSQLPGKTSVVGSFNRWQPGTTVLRKRNNGTWSATVDVPAGTTLAFRYLADGGHWFDDDTVHDRDAQGNCVLTA